MGWVRAKTGWVGGAVLLGGVTLAVGIYALLYFEGADLGEEQAKMLLEVFKFAITTMLFGGAALMYNSIREKAEEERKRTAEDHQRTREKAERDLQAQQEKAARDLQRQRETAEKEAELRSLHRQRLEGFLREFSVAYNDIKFLRRELRRACESDGVGAFKMSHPMYVQIMSALNRGQLRLEEFKRLVESKPAYLGALSGHHDLLARAESCLRRITREYEKRELPSSDDGLTLNIGPKSKVYHFIFADSNGVDHRVFDDFFGSLDLVFSKLADAIRARDESLMM